MRDRTGSVRPTVLLHGAARARLLNRAPRQWTRGEILRTAELLGVNPVPSAELRAFVPPKNYADLQRKLEKGRAIVLQGPPGAGKTQVLKKLKHEYRTRNEPFEFRAPQTLGELQEVLQSPGPIFVAVEEPWGKFKEASGADRWVSELPRLLESVDHDKRIVVTTREGILHELSEDSAERFQRFAVPLTYEHYDHKARCRILENKLADALPWQRELVKCEGARTARCVRSQGTAGGVLRQAPGAPLCRGAAKPRLEGRGSSAGCHRALGTPLTLPELDLQHEGVEQLEETPEGTYPRADSCREGPRRAAVEPRRRKPPGRRLQAALAD